MSAQHEDAVKALFENPPDKQEFLPAIVETKTSTIALVNQARAIQIRSNDDCRMADGFIEALKSAEDKWDGLTAPSREAAHKAWKASVALHDGLITELSETRKDLKRRRGEWYDEQERARREEERRLQEIARKQAEDEALAAAEAAEAAGDHEIAEAIVAQPITTPAVTVARTAPAASRLTAARTVWGAQVVDLMALVKAIAAGTQPITLVEPNMVALNGMARAAKSALAIPGVRSVERKV